MTKRENEMVIVHTLLQSINEMRILQKLMKPSSPKKRSIPLFEDLDIYEYNIISLHTPTSFNSLDESVEFYSNAQKTKVYPLNVVKNERDNFYGYFNNVHRFISTYQQDVITELNEALQPQTTLITNPISTPPKIDIQTYKDKISKLCKSLSLIDEVRDYNKSKEMRLSIRTKMLLGKPLLVYGFSITSLNKLAENQELGNINASFYSNGQKSLIVNGSRKTIHYNIPEDVPTAIKSIKTLDEVIKFTGYNDYIRTGFSPESLNIKYTDNLYGDNLLEQYRNDMLQRINKNSFVK
jgi:hypothetical protein